MGLERRAFVLSFLTGFAPPSVIGVVLAAVGGRNTLVYCGTLTPAPPCLGLCPCFGVAWLPFWSALVLVPVGVALGIALAKFSRPAPS